MPEPSGYYYPNRLARALLLAIEDVMGRTGLQHLLSLAELEAAVDVFPPDTLDLEFDFVDIAAVSEALEELYGIKGGRGIALRIGRASFAVGIRRFGAMRGIADPAFQALPLEHRIEIGLHGLASIFTNFSDQASSVEVTEDAILFSTEFSPMAWGRITDKPVCHALAGIIQECLRWSSNGYEFYVREISCRATGSEVCVFKINKMAIGESSAI